MEAFFRSCFSSGRHEPQPVPAPKRSPIADMLTREPDLIVCSIVCSPTLKQEQMVRPVCSSPCGGKPLSRANRSLPDSSVLSNKVHSQSDFGNWPFLAKNTQLCNC